LEINAKNIPENEARAQKEQLWQQLLNDLLPDGIPDKHQKDIEGIRKKSVDKNSLVKDVHLVAMAEHCREKSVIKEKITAFVNFISSNF